MSGSQPSRQDAPTYSNTNSWRDRFSTSQLGLWRLIGLLAGPLAFLLLITIDTPLQHYGSWGARPAYAAGVAVLMAIWWLTEALPIYVTACVPLILFPITRVYGASVIGNVTAVVLPYIDPYIFLFAGGMCIAAAMQQWNLHRRIALNIMQQIGTDPRRLLFGFLAATAFISLWISNTATATMMMPIGIAVIAQLESRLGNKRLQHYGTAIMLSIAYASNVGGIGTKIGTAPNAQFAGFMYNLGIEITFLKFMAVGLPFVVLFLPVVWLALWQVGRRDTMLQDVGSTAVAEEIAKLGITKRAEWIVLIIFLCTASLWIAGKPITDFLQPRITAFKLTSAQVEGSVAMLAALVLLSLRTDGQQTLRLRSLRTVPWESLLLLGGSFAMADGIQKSGLSDWLGKQLVVIRDLQPYWQVTLASVSTVAISAVASNTATIGIMLNVLKDGVSSSYLTTVLFTATIAASCDFALPAGTPPNAIVFGSGYITIPRMAKTGVLLDLAAALLAASWCWLIVRWVL
ncbi:MAG: DASS family sodium-coupled anion symporter [Acidobacteriota bacterium]